MFYIMTQQGHKIIELSDQRPTQEQLEKLAQECHETISLSILSPKSSQSFKVRPLPTPLTPSLSM